MPLNRMDQVLAAAQRRLRTRRAIRGAAVGAWVGVAAGATAVAIRHLGLVADPIPVTVAVMGLVIAVGIGGVVGAARPGLGSRQTALLLDQALQTEELLVTARWIQDQDPTPSRHAVLAALEQVDPALVPQVLPLRAPPHLRWVGVALLAVVIGLLLPAWRPAGLNVLGSDDPVTAAGTRLEERLEAPELEDTVALPQDLEREVAALADEMQGALLTQEEALDRLAELQQKLQAFEEGLQAQDDLLDDLEDAAQALENSAAHDLADALKAKDLQGASDAVDNLSNAMDGASTEQRQQAADALTQAGQRLQQSADPSLAQAGEALQQAGEAMKPGEGSQAGGEATGSDAGGGLSSEDAAALKDALDQARQTGQQLQQDEAALRRSQELNGALESSRQQLGGEPGVDAGQSKSPSSRSASECENGTGESGECENGEGENGEGNDQRNGGASQNTMSGVGDQHTWEDEGAFQVSQEDGLNGQRQSDRSEGRTIDDFEKLYRSLRVQDAEHLVTSAEGQLDEAGQVDELPTRITGADETSQQISLDVPAAYAEAAAEAIRAEAIPPGYREAVKQYFDEVDPESTQRTE